MPKGHGINTGPTLRDWLVTNKKGSPWEFYKFLKENPVFKERRYSIGSYDTVRTMFYLLHRKLELVDIVGHTPGPTGRTLSMYSIRRGYTRDMAWGDVYKFSYPETYSDNRVVKQYWEIRKKLGGASVTTEVFLKNGGKFI